MLRYNCAMTPETTPTAPAYPVIEIDGRRLVLKFDMIAKFRLSEMGVGALDLRMFRPAQKPEEIDPRVLSLCLKLFSCFVANNFVNREDPGTPTHIPSPEYWAAVIGDDMKMWVSVNKALGEAMGKAFLTGAGPAPAQQQVVGPTQ